MSPFKQSFLLSQLKSVRWEYQTTLQYKIYGNEFLRPDNYNNSYEHDVYFENINSTNSAEKNDS